MAKTILVLDDADITRLIATRALQAAGYEVIEATNAKAALSMLDVRSVSMMVSDLSMPVMVGIEFVKAVRKLPNCKFLPVLMLTAADEDELKQKGKDAGVNAWMTKPFKPNLLVETVNKLCR